MSAAAEPAKLRPPRTALGDERKRQLFDTARSLFIRHGYAKTRVSDICEAAGVSKGLVYWYFPSKESLFIEILCDMRDQLNHALEAAMDPGGDALTRLRQGAEAYLRFMFINHEFFTVVNSRRSVLAMSDEIAAWEASTDAATAALFAEAQAAGLVPEGDPRLYALGARGLMSAYVHAVGAEPERFDANEVIAFASTLLNRLCTTPDV